VPRLRAGLVESTGGSASSSGASDIRSASTAADHPGNQCPKSRKRIWKRASLGKAGADGARVYAVAVSGLRLHVAEHADCGALPEVRAPRSSWRRKARSVCGAPALKKLRLGKLAPPGEAGGRDRRGRRSGESLDARGDRAERQPCRENQRKPKRCPAGSCGLSKAPVECDNSIGHLQQGCIWNGSAGQNEKTVEKYLEYLRSVRNASLHTLINTATTWSIPNFFDATGVDTPA